MSAFIGMSGHAEAQQTGTISGTLTNARSGDVIPNAVVLLESPSLTRQVMSGPDGKFSLGDVPPGAYHLVVRGDGYLPSRTKITVQLGAQISDMRLNPELHFSEVTSVSPDAKSQVETFQATNVLGGPELTKEIQGTLGATIESQPGIALRSFGPGRPVVRGMDGDRVKPDPQIFHRALERLNVSPARSVFVGDHPEVDVAGARTAGMQAIWRRDPNGSRMIEADGVIDELSDLLTWLG